MRMSKMLQMHGLTMSTGDLDKGMTASGQSVGLVHDLPSIVELMETIIAEAEAVQRRLSDQIPLQHQESVVSLAGQLHRS
ncbi:hypothetical protein D9M73_277330 [compost metagenome]